MPADEIDIYGATELLIDEYGADAPIHAAMKVDAMLEGGDLDGVAAWKRIVRVIAEMQGAEGRTKH